MAPTPDNNEDRFSLPLCVFQWVAAPLGGLLLGGLAATIATQLVDTLTGSRGHQFGAWLMYALVGFAQGFTAQAVFPRSDISGGRFVWILPGILLALSFFDEFRRSPDTVFRDFLIVNPYFFDDRTISMFITMPAFASCCYVLGVIAAHRSLNAR